MRWLIVVVLAMFLSGLSAQAQSTRPAPADPWEQAVDDLARALCESDASALSQLISPSTAIVSFEARAGDPLKLLARTHKSKLLAAKAYVAAPQALASDLMAEVEQSDLPEDYKKRMRTGDEAQTRHANAVAGDWLASALSSKADDPVGVILLWCEGADGNGELVFVLVKGEAGNVSMKVSSIVFGDPLKQGR